MQENVGNADRWLRVAVGGALVLAGARALGAKRAVVSGLSLAGGAILLETAITRVCPVNAAFGIDTRGEQPGKRDDARWHAGSPELSASGQEDSPRARKPRAPRKAPQRPRRSAT